MLERDSNADLIEEIFEGGEEDDEAFSISSKSSKNRRGRHGREKSDGSNVESIRMEGRINHAQTLSGSVISPIKELVDEEGISPNLIGRNNHKKHLTHHFESQPDGRPNRRKNGEIFK